MGDIDRATFVDLGCGKGRVLVVASEFPFLRIIGVELSPALCEISRINCARIRCLHPDRTAIEVLEGDALGFEIPPGLTVIYFYNAFYAKLVKALATKIAAHQAANPESKVILIYYNPANAQIFDQCRAFSRFYAAKHVCDENERQSTAGGTSEDSVVIWQAVSKVMLDAHPGADATVRVVAGGAAGVVEQPVGS